MTLVRIAINGIFDGEWNADWSLALTVVLTITCGWFVIVFIYTFFRFRADEPLEKILTEEPGTRLNSPMTGFVGMEYYGLILNRTYVVFIGSDGLYGWRAEGAVDASNPMFFAPYEEMLKDNDLMTDQEAVRKLSRLGGGFFISRSEIAAVEVNYKPKWGMGGIQHSGRVRVRLASGKSREFVILGIVNPKAIQQSIMEGRAVPTANYQRPVNLPYVARYQKKSWVPLFAFWVALSGYFALHPTDTWTHGNWAYKIATALIIVAPLILLTEFVVQKLTFTESEIQRTTRLGRDLAYPYSQIHRFSITTDGVLKIQFEDGREWKIYRGIGSPREMIGILQAKTGKKLNAPA